MISVGWLDDGTEESVDNELVSLDLWVISSSQDQDWEYNKTDVASLPCCCSDEAEDPAAVPIYWVSKWVDYSDKYGVGYQLSDNSVAVLFNDSTHIILTNNYQYVNQLIRLG